MTSQQASIRTYQFVPVVCKWVFTCWFRRTFASMLQLFTDIKLQHAILRTSLLWLEPASLTSRRLYLRCRSLCRFWRNSCRFDAVSTGILGHSQWSHRSLRRVLRQGLRFLDAVSEELCVVPITISTANSERNFVNHARRVSLRPGLCSHWLCSVMPLCG